jgi:hypothetical protein
MIIGIKEKVITIYNINKWISIMIKKRIKLKIKIRKILLAISNIKTIHLRTINLTNKCKIIEKRIAIKNKIIKSMHNIIENQITKIWDKQKFGIPINKNKFKVLSKLIKIIHKFFHKM